MPAFPVTTHSASTNFHGEAATPRKAAYNRVYNRTTSDLFQLGRHSRKSGCLVMLVLFGKGGVASPRRSVGAERLVTNFVSGNAVRGALIVAKIAL